MTNKSHKIILLLESEGGSLNIASTSLQKARIYAESQFRKAGKDLDKEFPDFDKNYLALQKSMKKAIDVPRIDMPVIEPQDIHKFEDDITHGRVDIFKPFSNSSSKDLFPKDLLADKERAKEFLTLGFKDGNPNDDRVKAKIEHIEAHKLLPSQSQIWLEKVIDNLIKFGKPLVSEATLIVSKEGYILDGHHRYGQAMIGNPTLKMKALMVPLDINLLLKVGRSYGNAIGNHQKP